MAATTIKKGCQRRGRGRGNIVSTTMMRSWWFMVVSVCIFLLLWAEVDARHFDITSCTERGGRSINSSCLSSTLSGSRSSSSSSSPRAVQTTKNGITLSAPQQPASECVDGPKQRKTVHLLIRGGMSNPLPSALGGAVVMALIEKSVQRVFKVAKISFPSQLGGCIFLCAFLLIIEAIVPQMALRIYDLLSPGAALLAKWLPVFFVPGLAMLPLSPPLGSSIEIFKVVLTACLGFLYSITTTALAVKAVRAMQGHSSSLSPRTSSRKMFAKPGTVAPSAKPFGDESMKLFLLGSIMSGLVSIWAVKSKSTFETPIQTVFLGFSTVAAYIWSARLPLSFTKKFHPLVTSSLLLTGLLRLYATVIGSDYYTVLRSYRVKSLDWKVAGAGDVLIYLLGPAVVSLAISVFSRRTLLRSNLPVLFTAMVVSSVGGLFGVAAFVRMIQLGGKHGYVVRLSVLALNVTTALAMALTSVLGGDIAIIASIVCFTGILGATYGKSILDMMGVKDPISRGLAIGSSSLGLGVASLSDEPDAFPFAAMSMILTAVCATSVVTIPAIKNALIQLATGTRMLPGW